MGSRPTDALSGFGSSRQVPMVSNPCAAKRLPCAAARLKQEDAATLPADAFDADSSASELQGFRCRHGER
jgi:hypothetical protein